MDDNTVKISYKQPTLKLSTSKEQKCFRKYNNLFVFLPNLNKGLSAYKALIFSTFLFYIGHVLKLNTAAVIVEEEDSNIKSSPIC